MVMSSIIITNPKYGRHGCYKYINPLSSTSFSFPLLTFLVLQSSGAVHLLSQSDTLVDHDCAKHVFSVLRIPISSR